MDSRAYIDFHSDSQYQLGGKSSLVRRKRSFLNQAVTYSILANTLMVMLIPLVTAQEVRGHPSNLDISPPAQPHLRKVGRHICIFNFFIKDDFVNVNRFKTWGIDISVRFDIFSRTRVHVL